jgi:hypothetical protein
MDFPQLPESPAGNAGRPIGESVAPEEAVVSERAQMNFTDPDSRSMQTPDRF